MNGDERNALRISYARDLAIAVHGQAWHWFAYHLHTLPPHPFVCSIIEACIDCEEKLLGLGATLVTNLAKIGGIEKHEPHYDQLLQKLAEILILRQLLALPWPDGTTFAHEPAVHAGGRRPELKVDAPDQIYLFEVKAPSLLAHQRQRAQNGLQAPARMFDRAMLDRLADDQGLTLPRDNPLKDFLTDTEAKFEGFKAVQPIIGVLIIVWDDFIYEPITVLTQAQCGLLTDASYHRTEADEPVRYPSIDAVIAVRHLTYFKRAAGEAPLLERAHAFDFGDEGALPNVFMPVPGGQRIPKFIKEGLRALPLDDPIIERAAEYRPVEMVFWIDLDAPMPPEA